MIIARSIIEVIIYNKNKDKYTYYEYINVGGSEAGTELVKIRPKLYSAV